MTRSGATTNRPRVRSAAPGFTLVELLVALAVLATIAAMAWQGIDQIMRSQAAGRDSVARTTTLATAIAQWESDLAQLHDDRSEAAAVRVLSYGGRSLRLVRRAEGGLQIVAWALHGQRWQRWASTPTTRAGELQEAWTRSQAFEGTEPGHVTMIDAVDDVSFQCFHDNAWANCQSTATEPPSGIRLMLSIAGQRLTRDLRVAAAQ